ncbi:E3 ubiquitin ligase complex SCF subunit scon-3 [Aphelenchoides avenae]|nr:E3 ubiquitin ligase complex SCF subunit scon-3 [Aphelenchus avenae]
MSDSEENSQPATASVAHEDVTATDPAPETVATPGTVQCRTTDGGFFDVDIYSMRQSKLFNEKFPVAATDFSTGFDIPEPITKDLFPKVIEWCKYHQGKPEPVVEQDPNTRERKWFTFDDFETKFFEIETEKVCRLISCGELLEIKRLFLFGCQAIAALIKGKTPEQIREILGIEDDLEKPNPEHEGKKLVWVDQ